LNGVDALSLFGLFAVTAMLVFYAVEDRSPWFILAIELERAGQRAFNGRAAKALNSPWDACESPTESKARGNMPSGQPGLISFSPMNATAASRAALSSQTRCP